MKDLLGMYKGKPLMIEHDDIDEAKAYLQEALERMLWVEVDADMAKVAGIETKTFKV